MASSVLGEEEEGGGGGGDDEVGGGGMVDMLVVVGRGYYLGGFSLWDDPFPANRDLKI